MALPIDPARLPKGTTELRLSTNMEIYWDRIFVAVEEACPEVQRQDYPLLSAVVREVGFPQRSDTAERFPHYDYARRQPLWDTRHQPGYYTNFGDATPLAAAVDDAVIVIGPGEEIELEFAAESSPLAAGWTRRFVLESNGWCKDMDLYTEHGESLLPLPRRDASRDASPERDELHRQFNQRFRAH